MGTRVLVLGANFGGMTAALAVQHELGGDVDVTVASASDHFLFNPTAVMKRSARMRPGTRSASV